MSNGLLHCLFLYTIFLYCVFITPSQVSFHHLLSPLLSLLPLAITTVVGAHVFSFLPNPFNPHQPSSPNSCRPAFSECHYFACYEIPCMSEIMWYLFFSDWLISLRIMFSRFIHAFVKGRFPSFHSNYFCIYCVFSIEF